MQKVYFDNAATTAVYPEVIAVMTKVLQNTFGNPSATHGLGRTSKSTVEQARISIRKNLKVQHGEIYFTSGGTEANNLVLQNAVQYLEVDHLITSRIEHHAVLRVVEEFGKRYQHCQISYVNVLADGHIDLLHLEELLQQKSAKSLVSLMHVNNEIGTVLPMDRVGQLCKHYDSYFHSDMVQSIGRYSTNETLQDVDFATGSGHKFHGPKGIGFLYVKKGVPMHSMLFGGTQEKGVRPGTESVHNIAGMAKALEIVVKNYDEVYPEIQNLKKYFCEQLSIRIPRVLFNGLSEHSDRKNSATILNVTFPVSTEKAQMLLFHLDLNGIACSRGSACQSGSSKPSHVLGQIQSLDALKKASLRFSFSEYNTKKEVDYTVNLLQEYLAS